MEIIGLGVLFISSLIIVLSLGKEHEDVQTVSGALWALGAFIIYFY